MKYFTADVIDGNIRMKHHESVAVAVAPDDEDRAQGVAVCGLLQRHVSPGVAGPLGFRI